MTPTARTLRAASTSASSLRVSLWRIPRTRSLLAVGIVAVVSALVALAAHVYTDFLWFREVGQEQAFWTTLTWKVLVRLVIGFGTATFMLLNFLVVERTVAALMRQGKAPRPTRLWAYRNLAFPLAALAGALASNAWVAGGAWRTLVLWLHRGHFGVADPLFHRDVGFFVFSLPFYQQLAHWLHLMLVMAALGAIAGYVAAGAIRLARPVAIAGPARAHLLALGALLLVVMAWRYRLDQFALAVPHEDASVPGATYTDVHVQLPLLRVLVIGSLVGALLCLYIAWGRLSVPMLAATAVVLALLGVALVGRGAIPHVVQSLAVEPQELTRERAHVSDAIASTRAAFQLDSVDVRHMSGDGMVSAEELARDRRTLGNVPLWDSSVLQPAMNELQSIAPYYSFPSTTVDRYPIGGRQQLLTLGARQLDLEAVKPDARSWANERFAYTHGFGLVATTARQVDSQDQPGFVQHGVGARNDPLHLTEPRIYFGPRPDFDPKYIVLRTGRDEVEPADGGAHSEYHYDGAGGIRLSNPVRLFAFAARFGDPKLLLTRTVDRDSRIVLHRDARERLTTLAPFLSWDDEPETAVVGGRVVYLFHGYTTSDHYPYSERVRIGRSRFNYIRAAVQGVVDSFSGRVSLYVTEPGDPILQAWRAAYPGLFRDASEMPNELRAHLFYPERMFTAQLLAYETYHVGDATRLWTAQDAWNRPVKLAGPIEKAGEIAFPEANGVPLDPAYQYSRLPGDSRESFKLAIPFTPRGRQNVVGYLAGSLDRLGRPRLTLLSLPDNRLTIGPTQATRRILENAGVSKQLDLLNRESRDLGKSAVSRTFLGVPRSVPIGDAMLYVQPFYLIAGESGIPRLQLVAVHVNGRVGYGRDLAAALRMAVGAR